MNWLNQNAGAIQGISTAILVIVTILHARSTARLVGDGELSRLAELEPALMPVFLTCLASTDKEATPLLNFHLRMANSGRGTAYSVRLFLKLSGDEREEKPPVTWGRAVAMQSRLIQEEDSRPLSPASWSWS